MNNDLQVFLIHFHNSHGPLPIQAVRAKAVHGMFYTEMGRRFSDWVDELHQNQSSPLPYALAPMLQDGNFFGLRIACMDAATAERVAEVWGLLAAKGESVRLGSANLKVERVQPGKPGPCSYEQLLDKAPLALGVRLAFETPTRFRINGQVNLLPAPAYVWAHYARRWNAFTGIPLPPKFNLWVERQVSTAELDVQTCFTYVEGTVQWKGVVGQAVYQAMPGCQDIPESRYPDYVRAWQALASLAEFCGTGRKTNWGMGKTRKCETFSSMRIQQEHRQEVVG